MITGKYNINNTEFDVFFNTGIPKLDIILQDNDLLSKIYAEFITTSKSTDFSVFNSMQINGIDGEKPSSEMKIKLPTMFSIKLWDRADKSKHNVYKPMTFDSKSEFPKLRDNPNLFQGTILAKLINTECKEELTNSINSNLSKMFDEGGIGMLDKLDTSNILNRKLMAQALNTAQLELAYEETGNEVFLPSSVKDIFLF